MVFLAPGISFLDPLVVGSYYHYQFHRHLLRDVVTIALGMKGQPQVGVWPRVGAALINKAIRAAMLTSVAAR